MNELGQILDQQLEQLEGERRLGEEAIEEIHRRYGVLDDVSSWGLESEQESLELSAARLKL